MTTTHDVERLRSINLNLLVVLDALLQENSATRAARRLGITQSRVSHALAELRALFGDPLFVRSGSGLVPTAAASELLGPLRRGLHELAQVVSDEPVFEPASSQRGFRIAAADYTSAIFTPRLVSRLATHAPNVQVTIRPYEWDQAADQLARGEFDIAVGVGVDLASPEPIERQLLFTEQFRCVLRKDHPVVGRRLTREQYLTLPHLLVSPTGRGQAAGDVTLRRLGLARKIAIRTPYFLLAPHLAATTDLIVTLPGRMAAAMKDDRLRVLAPPFDIPGFDVVLLWHRRMSEAPALRWLREMLAWAMGAAARPPAAP